MQELQSRYDVVVVGSGAAGLTAALTAALRGRSVAVLEKAPVFGGTTAYSGGVLWIPANGYAPLRGRPIPDDPEVARQYLHAVTGGRVAPARVDAYVREGRLMLGELAARTRWMQWNQTPTPDYYPDVVGARATGRGIEVGIVDGRLLGAELDQLRPPSPATDLKGLTPTADEVFDLMTIGRTLRGKAAAVRMVARLIASRLRGEHLLSAGQALVARLRLSLIDLDVPLFLDTELQEVITQASAGGRSVTGVRVMHRGMEHVIHGTRGVVLAAGGFARNQAMRDAHHPQPSSTQWSLAADGDQGDGINAGLAVGAATDLMEHVWGMPSIVVPGPDSGTMALLTIGERCQPGSIIVDQSGVRYANEALNYHEFRQQMLRRNAAGKAVPSWLVFDQRAKNRYLFLNSPPRAPFPRRWIESGTVVKAGSIEKLAQAIGAPVENLSATLERFNQMAVSGRDRDFARGATFYDRRYADPRQAPNPALGPIDKAPFYAVRIHPGDLGTCGGLLIDEHSRVLDAEGQVITGLYAAGNTSASVMGGVYAGGGATLGAAMVAAYSAGKHIGGLESAP